MPAAYVIRRFNTEEAAGGLEDTFVLIRKVHPSPCAGPPVSSMCVFKIQLAGRIWQCNRTSRLPGEMEASDEVLLIFMG
jgi:hypothetical protein